MSNNIAYKQWFKTNLPSLIGGELAVAKKQDREPNFDFLDSWIESNLFKEASLPVEQVKNFMAHAYFQGALDRAEKKASEAAFNNWYSLNKDAFLLNQKEENNISQLQEVPPASVVCCDGNCKESENCELRKIDRELVEFASNISLQNLNNNPRTEGNSIDLNRLDIGGMPLRVGLKSLRDYFGEHDRSHFEHWAYGYLNKLLNSIQAPERSVARDDHRGDGDGNTIINDDEKYLRQREEGNIYKK